MEVGKLKKRMQDFEQKEIDFRVSFQKMRFYQFKCRQPYELLAEANSMIDDMEVEMKKFQDSAVLFEVQVSQICLWQQGIFQRLFVRFLTSAYCNNADERSRC